MIQERIWEDVDLNSKCIEFLEDSEKIKSCENELEIYNINMKELDAKDFLPSDRGSKQLPKSSKQPKCKFLLDMCLLSNCSSEDQKTTKSLPGIISDQYTAKLKSPTKTNSAKNVKSSFFDPNRKIEENLELVKLIEKIDKLTEKLPENTKKEIIFDYFERLDINADLILSHRESKGQIYLGSNHYKSNISNLEKFDTIVNIVGDYPQSIFPNSPKIKITLVENDGSPDLEETLVENEEGHQISFLVKQKENLKEYHYLVDKIHDCFLNGDRVLIHCQQGLVRSAALLLFYLRKYIFEDIGDANEFIGIKREQASCQTMFISQIERLILNNCI
jgi:hypothetical protein